MSEKSRTGDLANELEEHQLVISCLENEKHELEISYNERIRELTGGYTFSDTLESGDAIYELLARA